MTIQQTFRGGHRVYHYPGPLRRSRPRLRDLRTSRARAGRCPDLVQVRVIARNNLGSYMDAANLVDVSSQLLYLVTEMSGCGATRDAGRETQ